MIFKIGAASQLCCCVWEIDVTSRNQTQCDLRQLSNRCLLFVAKKITKTAGHIFCLWLTLAIWSVHHRPHAQEYYPGSLVAMHSGFGIAKPRQNGIKQGVGVDLLILLIVVDMIALTRSQDLGSLRYASLNFHILLYLCP